MEPNVRELLIELYGGSAGQVAMTRLQAMLDRHRADLVVHTSQRGALSQRDVMLITYGDQVREPNVPPLRTLAEFCDQHLTGVVRGVHILPFYPSSSDDGFSVIDYKCVWQNPLSGNSSKNQLPKFDIVMYICHCCQLSP